MEELEKHSPAAAAEAVSEEPQPTAAPIARPVPSSSSSSQPAPTDPSTGAQRPTSPASSSAPPPPPADDTQRTVSLTSECVCVCVCVCVCGSLYVLYMLHPCVKISFHLHVCMPDCVSASMALSCLSATGAFCLCRLSELVSSKPSKYWQRGLSGWR